MTTLAAIAFLIGSPTLALLGTWLTIPRECR